LIENTFRQLTIPTQEEKMNRYLLLFTTLLLTTFMGCSKVDDRTLYNAQQAVKNGAFILDVRTPKEFQIKHIDGAVNISIDLLEKSLDQLPKNKTIVVYCHSGSRSSRAAHFLTQHGWHVYDVATQSEFERVVKPI